jgi:ferrous iron transport protein B
LATKWSPAPAQPLLAWYILAPQCASTLAVIRRETAGSKWMTITFGYMVALAYAASLVTYTIAVALRAGQSPSDVPMLASCASNWEPSVKIHRIS